MRGESYTMWKEELKIAIDTARLAGNYLLENWSLSSVTLSSKHKDIKLSGDIESENRILSYISEHSRYPILSEERGKNVEFDISDTTIYWIIDPIDGSLNYNRDIPLACVSIALWKGEKPLLGAIYDFNRDEMYSRIVGQKLVINEREIDLTDLIREKKDAVIATGFPSGRAYDDHSLMGFVKKVQEYKKVRLIGSAALSLAWVACGRIDAYSEDGIYLWDIAAGLALLGSSKYEVSKLPGTEYKYYVLAGNVS